MKHASKQDEIISSGQYFLNGKNVRACLIISDMPNSEDF